MGEKKNIIRDFLIKPAEKVKEKKKKEDERKKLRYDIGKATRK